MYDFVVDSMFGKLSKWLRVLGYSTFYSPSTPDSKLIEIARANNALLITRDRELYAKAMSKGVNTLLIESTDLIETLSLLHRKFNIRLHIDFKLTRCSKCNAKLLQCNKEMIRDRVPESVLKRYDIFLVCPNCNSVYWPGKHYKNMLSILNLIKEQELD